MSASASQEVTSGSDSVKRRSGKRASRPHAHSDADVDDNVDPTKVATQTDSIARSIQYDVYSE